MMRTITYAATALLLLAGCGAGAGDEGEGLTEGEYPELKVGSTGPAVERVNGYLAEFGYFPNTELEAKYAAWRPVVRTTPARMDAFDGSTEAAVRALQKMAHLPETGVVDLATWERIEAPRCGVPDGIEDGSGNEKWSLQGSKLGSRVVDWKLVNTDDLLRTDIEAQVALAFDSWQRETDMTFLKTAFEADITIRFTDIAEGNGGNTLAVTSYPNSGSDMQIDTDENWTAQFLRNVVLHEIGHALGISHSSIRYSGDDVAVMYPWIDNDGVNFLYIDDTTAVSSLYDQWTQVDGCAKDIAASPNQTSTWVVGCTAAGAAGNYRLYRYDGREWVQKPGNAKRIAVDGFGTPWIVRADGDVLRQRSDDTWETLPGCARDIAADILGTAWIIGCTAEGNGYGIYKWNGAGWTKVSGSAVTIGMGPARRPWIIDSLDHIYRREADDSGWERMPGAAKDIGGNIDNVWVINEPGSIYVWNEQGSKTYADGSTAAPARRQWVQVPGAASRVGASVDGPWVVTSAGNIYHHVK